MASSIEPEIQKNRIDSKTPGKKRTALFLSGKQRIYSFMLIGVVVILFIVLSVLIPNFLTVHNFLNIFIQATVVGLLAIGVTPVLICGGIDLSLAALMVVAAILGTSLMGKTGNTFIGILAMLMMGTLGGVFNGFFVTKLKMVPFVVTFSTMVVASGFSVWYTGSESIFGLTDGFVNLGVGRIGPLPIPILILIIVGIISYLIFSRSFLGRWLYATGCNPKAARGCGIPTEKVGFLVYVISGFFAGLAAIIITARLGSASPTMAREGVILDYISAAVIGGVSIYGGKGTAVGAIIGALLITVLGNSMNMLGVTYFTSLIVKGLVIILAVGLDTLRTRQGNVKT
ncbi:MAG: ABC transporter permease [Actinobacteria bacterium]|nr:ABC transporter permease [Actinomycetota bacterium]